MDWSEKSPFQWDWDNHGLLTGKEGEISIAKTTQSGMPIRNGSIYSSDLGNCSSRSSISTSIDSSLKAGVKVPGFNLGVVEAFPKALNKDKELARVEDTRTSKEPLIGLKLGKRTYFEDVGGGSNTKISSSESSKVPSSTLAKKTRVSHPSVVSSQCQVEGCGIDLSEAKDYHRKHRVCDSHSRCPVVIVGGQERRFCQQCSRFHDLSEFDQKKRSCRRRLSDHNARRRKPQTNTISFNSSRLSSPFYDDRQQMNFLLNRAPFAHMRPATSSTQEDSCGFSITHSRGSWVKSARPGMDSPNFSNSGLSNMVPTTPRDLEKLLAFKGTTADALSQGIEASASASNLDGAQDYQRALSLLSTDTWGSLNPGQSNIAHFINTGPNNASHPSMHVVNTSVGYWQDQQTLPQQARTLPFDLHDNSTQYDTSFFDHGQLLSKSNGHFLES